MLFVLCLLFTGGNCPNVPDVRKTMVQLNSVATLPCPHAAGDVSWTRLINGDHVILVTITNGQEDRRDKRCGSLVDKSLVIFNVRSSDSAWYFCNRRPTAYLEVTTDLTVTPGHDRPGFVLETDHSGTDSEDRQSDLWKILVGVVIGAALVLLVFTLRLCLGRRADRNRDTPEAEVIYEDIRPPDGDTPYNWSSVTEASNWTVSSTVNELKVKGRCTDTECVYSFVQNPPQTGNDQDPHTHLENISVIHL
nr:PREDICTED: uncharacterized protein LOC109646025 [Paralichthys olivaceus]